MLDRLCALARPWYVYFADNLTLGRYAFREMTFYEPHSIDFGEQCTRYRARMHRIESWHSEIVAQGKERGELKFKGDAAVAGNLIYKIYLARDPHLDPRHEAGCRGRASRACARSSRSCWMGCGGDFAWEPRRL